MRWRRPRVEWDHVPEPATSGKSGTPADVALGDECTALLEGRAMDLSTEGALPPAWAWINVFAHGSSDQISALVSGQRGRASAFLAQEILGVARHDEDLRYLQRRALVPIELELMRPSSRRAVGVAEVVQVAVDAIHHAVEQPWR
ncbi:MAG: hypothetical protein ACYDD4_13860 [Acidimicrobiales bacterium]